MDILKDLVKRLEKLQLSQDPVEVKALNGWVREGGLSSLESTLLTEIAAVEKKEIKVITLKVQRFDEAKEHSFDLLPYTTVRELTESIVKDLNIPFDNVTLRFEYEVGPFGQREWVAIPSSSSDSLGEVLHDYDDRQIHVLAFPATDPFQKVTTINMPITVNHLTYSQDLKEKVPSGSVKFSVSLTADMNMNQLIGEINRHAALSLGGLIIFLSPEVERAKVYSARLSTGYADCTVWKIWQGHGYSDVIVTDYTIKEINPSANGCAEEIHEGVGDFGS